MLIRTITEDGEDAQEADDGTGFTTSAAAHGHQADANASSSSRWNSGFRFNNVTLSGKIYAAWVEFETSSLTDVDADCRVYCEDVDDSADFTTTADVTSRTTTTAYSDWDAIPAYYVIRYPPSPAVSIYLLRTPDFAPAVQEVIDRGGWSSGNDLMVIIKGQATSTSAIRLGEGGQGSGFKDPTLKVLYSPSGSIAKHKVSVVQ